MKCTIFYSWQSDLPNSTNRRFIEKAIDSSIKTMKGDPTFELELCLDRDTSNVPGAPDIADTIFNKISEADIFVADVSIVIGNANANERPSPNPNVLIELGFAVKSLGWEKIVLICNVHYGVISELPFDIRHRRILTYSLGPEQDKGESKSVLSSVFIVALKQIVENYTPTHLSKQPALSIEWVVVEANHENMITDTIHYRSLPLKKADSIINIEAEITNEINEVRTLDGCYDLEWKNKVKKYEDACLKFLSEMATDQSKINFIIDQNKNNVREVGLQLINSGTVRSNDVHLVIDIPESLVVFEKYPEDSETPVRPRKPNPKWAVIESFAKLGNTLAQEWTKSLGFQDSVLSDIVLNTTPREKPTSGCYLDKNKIKLWANEVPHQRVITISGDKLFILALPEHEDGNHQLSGKIICDEYLDWQPVTVSYEVT